MASRLRRAREEQSAQTLGWAGVSNQLVSLQKWKSAHCSKSGSKSDKLQHTEKIRGWYDRANPERAQLKLEAGESVVSGDWCKSKRKVVHHHEDQGLLSCNSGAVRLTVMATTLAAVVAAFVGANPVERHVARWDAPPHHTPSTMVTPLP